MTGPHLAFVTLCLLIGGCMVWAVVRGVVGFGG
jgi:hypothetical protein